MRISYCFSKDSKVDEVGCGSDLGRRGSRRCVGSISMSCDGVNMAGRKKRMPFLGRPRRVRLRGWPSRGKVKLVTLSRIR